MGITVGQLMTRPVLAVTPRANVRDIAAHLVRAGIGSVPVADKEGAISGIVTAREIIGAIAGGRKLESMAAEQIMRTDTVTIDAGKDISEALTLLMEGRLQPLLVTQGGRLVGILSRSDAVKALVEDAEFFLL